jgi:hypothetical protein
MNDQNLKPFPAGDAHPRKGGRPKGSKNLTTLLQKYLKTKAEVEHPTSGKKVKVAMQDVIAMKLIDLAQSGNIKAIAQIWDRIEGKPMQHHEIMQLQDPAAPPRDPLAITEHVLKIQVSNATAEPATS